MIMWKFHILQDCLPPDLVFHYGSIQTPQIQNMAESLTARDTSSFIGTVICYIKAQLISGKFGWEMEVIHGMN